MNWHPLPLSYFFRWATLAITLWCIPFHAGAVLKEKDLAATLTVLRAELESSYNEQRQNIAQYNIIAQMQHKQMISLMQRSDQIGLMLYSQKQDFTFDMTYACHEATSLFREFNKQSMPYQKILDRINTELNRYNALIASLQTIPPSTGMSNAAHAQVPVKGRPALPILVGPDKKMQGQMPMGAQPFILDKQGQADRNACLKYSTALRNNLERLKASVIADNEHYKMTSRKLQKLNNYALERYQAIQHNIFVNGDVNYFEVLGQLKRYISQAKSDASEKYNTEHIQVGKKENRPVHSQWRGPIVMGLTFFVFFYIIIAALLSNVLVRWLVPKRFRTEEFMKKKVCLILAAAMMIFAISIMIARTFMYHNFFLMASRLLIEYSWLLCAIFISLLIRLTGDQIKSGFRIYTPIMLMSFIVITFRIIFIPNNLVQLIFPPILLIFTLWQ